MHLQKVCQGLEGKTLSNLDEAFSKQVLTLGKKKKLNEMQDAPLRDKKGGVIKASFLLTHVHSQSFLSALLSLLIGLLCQNAGCDAPLEIDLKNPRVMGTCTVCEIPDICHCLDLCFPLADSLVTPTNVLVQFGQWSQREKNNQISTSSYLQKCGPGIGTLPQLEPPVVQVVVSNAKNHQQQQQQSDSILPQIVSKGVQSNFQSQVRPAECFLSESWKYLSDVTFLWQPFQ